MGRRADRGRRASRRTRPWQIAREFTDRVIVRPWPGFAAQKNFGLAEAGGDWILSLDADEQVSSRAARGDRSRAGRRTGSHDGYRVPRRNIFWGRTGSATAASAPTGSSGSSAAGRGRFGERAVHESVEVTGACRSSLGAAHPPELSRRVADFLARADRYSTLAAEERARSGARVGPSDAGPAPGWADSCPCTSCGAASSTGDGASFWRRSTRTMCFIRSVKVVGAKGGPLMATPAKERVLSGMRPSGRCTWATIWARWPTGSSCRTRWTASTSSPTGTLLTDHLDTSDVPATPSRCWPTGSAPGSIPSASTLFVQSLVPEHAELHLLFSMIDAGEPGWSACRPTASASSSSTWSRRPTGCSAIRCCSPRTS